MSDRLHSPSHLHPQSSSESSASAHPLLAGTSPDVRLLHHASVDSHEPAVSSLPQAGQWFIEGSAGTGVTTLLADIAVDRVREGADPSGVLIIAPDKESGSRIRAHLAARLGATGAAAHPASAEREPEDNEAAHPEYSSTETMVRSVHSLAFALLRLQRDAEVRMLTGAEQDAIIRQLLRGHADDVERGASLVIPWPEEIRPALGYVGFARAVRDFLLRAVERRLGPTELIEYGELHRRPMWVAAGHFLREYEQITRLAGTEQYSAPELMNLVLESDVDQLIAGRWHTVLVDDAQLLDPMAGALVEKLLAHAELGVVAGDRDKAVFGFRGANEKFFLAREKTVDADKRIVLTKQQRFAPDASRRVVVADSPHVHWDVVADAVRRRHLIDDVAWRDIAVVVRDSALIGRIRRTLLASGVPVTINPTDVVLSEQRIVANLLLALRAVGNGISTLSYSEVEDLITGPVGGADPVSLRRLLRGLRRWAPDERAAETLRYVLENEVAELDAILTERELAVLERVKAVLRAGRKAVAAQEPNENILWAVWEATKLSTRLQTAALRGGATGSQADRDLDAVMALFDVFGDLAERRAEYSLQACIDFVLTQELPTGVRDRRLSPPDAVAVVTAHGAVGREWDTVIVAGVQEDSWPSLGETGSLFGQEDLVDLIDEGIDPDVPVSHTAARLKEERRLFHVACTRHRSALVVTATDSEDGEDVMEPSRFLSEAAEAWGMSIEQATAADATRTTGAAGGTTIADGDQNEEEPSALTVSLLSAPAFVGRLRRIVGSANATEVERKQAARQLARMAEAGVPGADPDSWWAARETVGERPRRERAALSPSRIESLMKCPLQAVLRNANEEEERSLALDQGNLAHYYFEALGRGVDEEWARLEVLDAFRVVQTSPQWKRQMELDAFQDILDKTYRFHQVYANAEDLLGLEVDIDVEVAPGVRITGRADALQRVGDKVRIVDLKTGKSVPTHKEIGEYVQLQAYQLALRHGQLAAGNDVDSGQNSGQIPGQLKVVDGPGIEVEDATLMLVNTKTQKLDTRVQVAMDEDGLDAFARKLPPLVEQSAAPKLLAIENNDCDRCPVRTICPLRNEGTLTTDA